LLDKDVVAAPIGGHETGARNGVQPTLVGARLGVDFRALFRAQPVNGTRRKRHFGRADRVDEDQLNARRNATDPRLFRGFPRDSQLGVERVLKLFRILMGGIDEHHPAHLLWIRSRKHSNVEAAERGAHQYIRRLQARRAKRVMQFGGDLTAIAR